MTADKDKLANATKQATQPGPWKAVREPSTNHWRVVDANGFWVCDVGEDPHQARFIAAASPLAIEAVLGELEQLSADKWLFEGTASSWKEHAQKAEARIAAAETEIKKLRAALRAANERLKRAGCLPIEVST